MCFFKNTQHKEWQRFCDFLSMAYGIVDVDKSDENVI